MGFRIPGSGPRVAGLVVSPRPIAELHPKPLTPMLYTTNFPASLQNNSILLNHPSPIPSTPTRNPQPQLETLNSGSFQCRWLWQRPARAGSPSRTPAHRGFSSVCTLETQRPQEEPLKEPITRQCSECYLGARNARMGFWCTLYDGSCKEP